MTTDTRDSGYPLLVQPKPWIRWAGVCLAVLGWLVAFSAFRVSSGGQDPLARLVCAGGPDKDGCASVLRSPQAYLNQGPGPRLPVSTLGMGYFALLGLWFLFIGPPTRSRRLWHFVLVAVVCVGVLQSLHYLAQMAFELRRWCRLCLAAHAVNGGFVLLTVLAWPWRGRPETGRPHPSARLVLATVTAGALALVVHVAVVFVVLAGSVLKERTAEYAAVLDDPAFIRWDFGRQPAVPLPLGGDEVFAGSPEAAHTIVVFGDFQCTACRRAHDVLEQVLDRYSGRVRIAFRHAPQDPTCNPNPRFRAGGHASACRAARAVEAARILGGAEAFRAMSGLLFERQRELAAARGDRADALLVAWAEELGLDAAAFRQMLDAPQVEERIREDIALADSLGLAGMPVIYLDGKRVRRWSRIETWEILLGEPTSRPGSP